MFTFLSGQGITCHSYDARWHGRSEPDDEQRIKIESFDTLVTDMEELCKQKRAGAVEMPSDVPVLRNTLQCFLTAVCQRYMVSMIKIMLPVEFPDMPVHVALMNSLSGEVWLGATPMYLV